MENVTLKIADALPLNMIMERMKHFLKAYESDPSNENMTQLDIYCTLFGMKCTINRASGGLAQIAKEFKAIKAAQKFMSPEKN